MSYTLIAMKGGMAEAGWFEVGTIKGDGPAFVHEIDDDDNEAT